QVWHIWWRYQHDFKGRVRPRAYSASRTGSLRRPTSVQPVRAAPRHGMKQLADILPVIGLAMLILVFALILISAVNPRQFEPEENEGEDHTGDERVAGPGRKGGGPADQGCRQLRQPVNRHAEVRRHEAENPGVDSKP